VKFIDGTEVPVFSPSEEMPHAPGDGELWQESFVLYWYDMQHHVGGGFRLGWVPHYEGGQTQFVIVILAPDGVYRRCGSLPLRNHDVSAEGVSNGDDSLRYAFDGERIQWRLKDDDVEAQLSVELTVPAIDAHRRAGIDSAEAILSAHIDAPCQVTGTMSVKGTHYEVNALGVRDHAWGTRDLSALRSHRWCIANLGEDTSFVVMTFLSSDDRLARLGWVIRDDTVLLAQDASTRATVTDDGATNVGGTVRMSLETGELFEAAFVPLYPTLTLDYVHVHPTVYHDAYSRVTWGDKVGFGIFETSSNIRGGLLVPRLLDGSIGANGWHHGVRPLGS
jgi:hypothetical protein